MFVWSTQRHLFNRKVVVSGRWVERSMYGLRTEK